MGGPDFRADAGLAAVAEDVAGRLPNDGTRQAIPVALIVAALQAAMIVLQACRPGPAEAAAWLRPPVFGWRLWERQIRAAVRRGWRGDPARLPAVEAAVIERVRAGVGPGLVARLFAEAGN